jgi:UPF0755 protein
VTSILLLIRFAFDAAAFHVARQPRKYGIVALVLVGLFLLIAFVSVPPSGFPKGALIIVPEDASFGEVAELLESKGIVSSALALRVMARLTGSDTSINAGRYLFEEPQCMTRVLSRLARGEHGIPSVRITFPEGASMQEMGSLLAATLAGFDERAWDEQTKGLEGYLFPDTYDFYKDATVEEVVARMQENFANRTKELQAEAAEKGIDFDEIVIMASLIEKEANTEEDRHIVSGILWSRIEEDVALQVDATFGYIRGIPGYEPTGDDPEIESPYNTYLNRGLPPGPITNPGLDALDAALHPTETDYFYYLTGKDGKMYYAKSFEEHKRNREQYLD